MAVPMAPSITRIRSRSSAVSSSVASGRMSMGNAAPRVRGLGHQPRNLRPGGGRGYRMVTPGRSAKKSRRAIYAMVGSHRVVAVIEIEDVPDLVDPVVIAAFEGWNDAADAASSVIDHLIKVWGARIIGAIDPEECYDFQVNRPLVGTDERGHRTITWPSTQIAIASPPDLHRDVILIRGIEPNMRWRQFCAELLAAADDLGGQIVVTLGALLADTPRTRPAPASGTATEPELVDRLKLEVSTYEGPTGIV